MNKKNRELQKEWNERESLFGSNKRAVLFKRFPNWLNAWIHKRHVKFILNNLPSQFSTLLDVGCGYGRLSNEISSKHPDTNFSGIELCTNFSQIYEKKYGLCFNGPIQDFHSDNKYDVVVVVTLLMYLSEDERESVIKKLYSYLNQGGLIICIEPAIEFNDFWKTITRKKHASPTGGSVKYFSKTELCNLFPGTLVDSMSINLIPWFKPTALHHGVIIVKDSNP